jgi:ribose transport system substrate-binding protein
MHSGARRRWLASVAACLAAPYMAWPARAFAEIRRPTIGLVLKGLDSEYFQRMLQAARDYQAHSPDRFELVTGGASGELDSAEQSRVVEQMIVQRVDALVIAPADSVSLLPVVQRAIAAGILVINVDNRFDPNELAKRQLNVPYVGPDNRKGAFQAGLYLTKKLQAGDPVAVIEGVPGAANSKQRTDGYLDAMKNAQARVVGVRTGNWTIDGGRQAATALLSVAPQLKALLCGNDYMAIGAVSALRAAGRRGKVYVVGYDNIDAVRPLIQDGLILATVDQYGPKQAVFGIDTALKAIEEYRHQNDLSSRVETPIQLVTRN